MSDVINGGCLCGRVKFQVTPPFIAFHVCHCSQCQRSTGSAHASNIFCDKENIEWLQGEDLVRRFDPEEAGVISKAFCTHCGSLVPYISAKNGKLVIPAGSLSDDPGITPQDNIFWEDRASWYDSVITAPRFGAFPPK